MNLEYNQQYKYNYLFAIFAPDFAMKNKESGIALNKAAGCILAAVAAVSYGMNPTFALPLYADGLDPVSVLSLRYGMAIPMLAVLISCRGFSFRIPAKSILPLALLGLLMSLSSLTLFVSYNYMAAGIASTILFVYPILVAVIMALFFREKLSLRIVTCLVLASAGILMLYHSEPGETISLTGTVIVLLSALVYALYLVGINNKKVIGLNSLVVTFYVLLFGFLLFPVLMLAGGSELVIPDKWYLWLNSAALALFPTIISLVCTAGAIKRIGSTSTAIFGALEPVTAVIMGILLFNEGMTLREAAGILMILVSVSFVISNGKK